MVETVQGLLVCTYLVILAFCVQVFFLFVFFLESSCLPVFFIYIKNPLKFVIVLCANIV